MLGKLLQNYKEFECEIFRISFKTGKRSFDLQDSTFEVLKIFLYLSVK